MSRDRDIAGQIRNHLGTREDRDSVASAVAAIIRAVEHYGGVQEHRWQYQPTCAPGWVAMGEAYIDLCSAIGRSPLVVEHHEPKEDGLTPEARE